MEQPKKDPQKELEIALSELEERVDRLRSLYEQYFMGYEKTEPGVQRKDVDRRFTLLRKTQIRNTAQRYRFNVIAQKFNTYSMYWSRICRQIEEGTYKRHVAKAARRFGGPGARQREADLSIDVDLADFENLEADDLESALAEANAAAEAYARGDSPDTIPPGARTEPSSRPVPSARPQTLVRTTPGSSFANAASPAQHGRRETFDSAPDSDTPPAQSGGAVRMARPAPLPAGAKPRIVVRRREPSDPEAAPISTRNVDPNAPATRAPAGAAAGARAASSSGAMRPPAGAAPDRAGPPSSSAMRTSAGPIVRPVGGGPALRPPGESSRRLPAAPPSAPESSRRLPTGPESARRVPAASPGSVRNVPAAPPSAPGSVRSVPAASAPGSVRSVPAAAPSAPGSVRSVPAAAPSAPGSVRSVPAAAPSAPGSARSVPVASASAPESVRRAPPSGPDSVRRPAVAPASRESSPALGAGRAGPAQAPKQPDPGALQAQRRAAASPATATSKLPAGRVAGPTPSRPSLDAGPSSRPSLLPPDSDQPRSRRPPPPLPSQLKKNT